MKNFKYFISLFLAAVMLFGILPFDAFAGDKVTISEIDVKVDEYPFIGLTMFDIPAPYVDENCGYYIETWYWYDDSWGYENHTVSEFEPFAKDHTYRLYVYLKPTDDHKFSGEMSVTVNGTTEQLWPFYSFEENGGYLWTMSKPAVLQAITDDVSIDGLCVPRIGQTAGDNLKNIELDPDANYHISEIYWRCVAGELNDDDKFEAGKKYYLVVRLAPNDDYCFDGDNAPDVYMNGTDDYIDKEYTFVLDDGTLSFFTVEFSPLEVISSAEIGGFIPPTVGMAAKNAQYPTVFVELPYEIAFKGWFDETDSEYLEPDDVFVKGKKYSICVELKPKEGYTFTDSTTAMINGGADLVDTNFTCANFDGTFSLWSVPDYALYFGEKEKVSAINVDVNEFPVVGVRAGDLADPVCNTQYGYEIAESYWFNDTDHVAVDVDEVFAADKSYSLFVRVVPVPGFEYDDSVYLTVNSLSELVESEFSFVAPDGAGIWTISRHAVLYGDVNGDRVVNLKDATLIRRYYVGGWSVMLDETIADVNCDDVVNLKDATLIRRYYVGGWDAVLGPQ
ncbi:MAG: dockerin type I repeat-containing protein [Clostridia bacterium]|nr:dockerin type I repeat-containing protein [Clostridia bacterium]